MAHKIPTTVVTGFLGAGKTTLIQHLLENAAGRRIALIINEFGDLGVDGEVLKSCGNSACREEDIVELSNGCICCTVAEEFVPALQNLLARKECPDHIVIETSGLALPQPLVRAFNWPEIATQVTVDGVITVIDGQAVAEGRFAHDPAAVEAQRQSDTSLSHETPLAELFDDQIACADMVVVNKADLMDKAAADRLIAELRGNTRDGVQVVRATMGALPTDVLLGQKAGAEESLKARHEIHHSENHVHDHDEFETFVVSLAEIKDQKAFAEQIAKVIRTHDILRLKGFAAVAGKPLRLAVQAVGPRIETYFDRPFRPGESRASKLAIIGETGLDRAAIIAAFEA